MMRKCLLLIVFVLFSSALLPVLGQKVSGKSFSFPGGKNEWSDTLFARVQTKKMLKEGIKPVTLGIRIKVVKPLADGFVYALEVTNTSVADKIKFKVNSKNSAEGFTIKLDPAETKVYQKMHLNPKPAGTSRTSQKESDIFFDLPIDELIHNRD